jgi:hypothetical protein
MRLLLAMAATAVVAWRLGRRNLCPDCAADHAAARRAIARYGKADWGRFKSLDEMDAVQPSDPWPPRSNVEPVSDEEWPDITPYFTRRTIGGMH